MLLNRKKLFAILLIFFSLLIISWFVLFEYSVRWLEKSIDTLTSNLKQKGYTVSYSKVEITGNPFSLKAIFQNPYIKNPKGSLEWQGQAMEISIRPWQLFTLTCTFPGHQKIFIPQTTPIPLGVLQFEGTIGIFTLNSQGNLEDVDFTVNRISSVIGSQPQPVFFQNTSLKIKNLSDLLNLKFAFFANVLNLEKPLNIPPHDHPFKINFEANLSGYQPKDSFPQSLAQWRDGGGVIEISSLKLTWPPMSIRAEGTLTLDKNMYPLGSFSSKVVGFQDALADIVKLGWVKKKNAAAASFILDLFSVPDETYGRILTIPITLQNKALSIGPAPLLKLRPIEDF